MSLSLDISVCKHWAMWNSHKCHDWNKRKESSVSMAVVLLFCYQHGVTQGYHRLLSLSGDHFRDCSKKNKIYNFLTILISAFSWTLSTVPRVDLQMKQNWFYLPPPPPSFRQSLRTLSEPSLGDLHQEWVCCDPRPAWCREGSCSNSTADVVPRASSLLPDGVPVVCFHLSTIKSSLPGEAPAFPLGGNRSRQLLLLANTATIQITANLCHWLEFKMGLTSDFCRSELMPTLNRNRRWCQ